MYFSGKVSDVVFSKKQQGFYILRMLLDESSGSTEFVALGDTLGFVGENLVVVKGYVPGLTVQVGSWFGFEGKWIQDEKYGRQLEISKAPVFKGCIDPETVSRLLMDNGVADMVTYELRRHFGRSMAEALKSPARIQEALGISSFEAEFISTRWCSIHRKLQALEAINNLGLPKSKIGEIWGLFGDDTEEILTTNPWALVRVDGISFAKMDELAQTSGIPLEGLSRRKAAVIFACREALASGDLFLGSQAVLAAVQRMTPDLTAPQIAEAIRECHSEGSLVVDKSTRPGVTAIYDPWHFTLESESASELWNRVHNAALEPEYFVRMATAGERTNVVVKSGGTPLEIVQTVIQECSEQIGFSLSPAQFEGVRNGLLHPVSILTGLPGTGKSTSMQVLVQVLRASKIPFLLVAPTGIAAKRLGSVCHSVAFTIHRALGAKGKDDNDQRESTYAGIVGEARDRKRSKGGDHWGHCPSNPYPAEVVILDECSMVDQHLLHRVLQGTSPTTRLVLVGDAAQLPSVGPGNVLRDMISSGAFPVVSLTQIFRQEDTSDIVKAAHAMFRGEVPETGRNTDFVLLAVKEETEVLQVILRLAKKLYEVADSWSGSGPPPTFQVLSPRHMGTVGVTNLNSHLRQVLNPRSEHLAEIRLGKEDAREHDRVMVVKNNYDLGVFNGDIGTVMKIDRRAKIVKVKIHGEPPMLVTFPLSEVYNHLRLAYACTVHKYQGLEVDTVVIPVLPVFRHQLQRNLYYTAVTRARKKVILVGSHAALEAAVRNSKEDLRNTLFLDRLQRLFSIVRTASEETA